MNSVRNLALLLFTSYAINACNQSSSKPSKEVIDELDLKSGQVISCGPPEKEFGQVDFEMTCNQNVKGDFNTAVELLHSFEYAEAEKVFSKIIEVAPECAMGYWGVAMCSFHPLWEPPTDADLRKGAKAIEIGNSIQRKSERESEYIDAVAAYYLNWNITNPDVRARNFEKAMEQLHAKYPDDKEAAIFYALSLDAAANPMDKSYANQKKAGEILNALYIKEPNHPGIIHYIIHTYDYPQIASLGLDAAQRYARVAPSSSHALHMPSHIFVRLGLWDDCIKSNIQSVSAAKCYAESSGIKAHWDEELHGLDYLVYAYLQKGDNSSARDQLKYINGIDSVYPLNFKSAYTFAAVPCRVALENKNWKEAANVQLHRNFPWYKFPWQESIIHFTRLLGNAHLGNMEAAKVELDKLNELHDALEKLTDINRTKAVAIQIKAGEAWVELAKGKKSEALSLMKNAADMEDSTSKHPVTPGEVRPARELFADMLLQLKENDKALQAYETVLQNNPNRFNSLYGAAVASQRKGDVNKAASYFKQLIGIADLHSERSELLDAMDFLKTH